MTRSVGAVWKFTLVLWSYILEPAEVLHIFSVCIFSFVKTKTNMYKKIVNKKKKKQPATEMLM